MLEFEKAMDSIENCQTKYKNEFISYMQQRSAEADRRSAEADRRSAEAVKEIMQQDSIRVKERMTEFYDLYIQNPNNIKQDDLNFMKESTKEFIADCKKR